jgi:hypothetical protein
MCADGSGVAASFGDVAVANDRHQHAVLIHGGVDLILNRRGQVDIRDCWVKKSKEVEEGGGKRESEGKDKERGKINMC